MQIIATSANPHYKKARAEIHKLFLAPISQTENIRLKGSWSTREFHLSVNANGALTYSDIDLVITEPIEAPVRKKLQADLHQLADSIHLQFNGVSFRDESDMLSMWSLSHHRSGERCKTRGPYWNFIGFWILIGAVDCAMKTLNSQAPLAHRYFHNKHFINIWRDIGLTLSVPVFSYKDVAEFLASRIGRDLAMASYSLKLGTLPSCSWICVKNSMVSSLRSYLKPYPQAYNALEMAEDMFASRFNQKVRLAIELLDHSSRHFAGGKNHMKALVHLRAKLEEHL